jgi:hypothetical protein
MHVIVYIICDAHYVCFSGTLNSYTWSGAELPVMATVAIYRDGAAFRVSAILSATP